jgi:hypothetical protein
MSGKLDIWVVFGTGTRDFPGVFVCRRNEIGPGTVTITEDHFTGDSLDDIRRQLPPGLHRMDRHPEDDPNIIETWL